MWLPLTLLVVTLSTAPGVNGKRLYTAIEMKNKFACVAENLKVVGLLGLDKR